MERNITLVQADSWSCLEIPGLGFPVDNVNLVGIELQFLAVFCTTQLLHHAFFSRLRLPPLVSQLFVGLLLGHDSVLGKKFKFFQQMNEYIFPKASKRVWASMAMLGYTWSLFMIAVKMDYHLMATTGRKAYLIGLLGPLVPIFVTFTTAALLGKDPTSQLESNKVLLGTAASLPLTHFQVVVCLLTDLDLLNSELGRLALSSTLIGEIVVIALTMLGNNILANLRSDNDKAAAQDTSHMQIFGPILLVLVAVCLPSPNELDD